MDTQSDVEALLTRIATALELDNTVLLRLIQVASRLDLNLVADVDLTSIIQFAESSPHSEELPPATNCPKCEDPEAPTLHRHPVAADAAPPGKVEDVVTAEAIREKWLHWPQHNSSSELGPNHEFGHAWRDCVPCVVWVLLEMNTTLRTRIAPAAPPPDVAGLVERLREFVEHRGYHNVADCIPFDKAMRLLRDCLATLTSRPPAPGVDVDALCHEVETALGNGGWLPIAQRRAADAIRAFFASRPPQPATEEPKP